MTLAVNELMMMTTIKVMVMVMVLTSAESLLTGSGPLRPVSSCMAGFLHWRGTVGDGRRVSVVKPLLAPVIGGRQAG